MSMRTVAKVDPYAAFLDKKTSLGDPSGFEPVWMPDFLFDFQKAIVEWAIRMGRATILADCGLGKTPMLLVWAENVARKTGKNVLILTPIAVGAQTIREGEKFGVEVTRSLDGKPYRITVTNYERLHLFHPEDFVGVVTDEASILKSFEGAYRTEITLFMRKIPYRLLDTATAAPNDYIELGTLSEALGGLGYIDMLNRFFKNDQNNSATRRMYGEAPKWRFKGHAEIPFWRWVTSWARACRRPSDLGFDDGPFILPELIERQHLVDTESVPDGMLFSMPANNLREQRDEKRRTIGERCEMVASLVANTNEPAIVWCQLNDEADLLEELIPDALQVGGEKSGNSSDAIKEARFTDFSEGRLRVLITKPKIGAWGLNWQHCHHVCYFPSHSFEQYYQAVRRCWRFGQTKPVTVDIPLTEGERLVMSNLSRKAAGADRMFANLVTEMNSSIAHTKLNEFTKREEVPSWL